MSFCRCAVQPSAVESAKKVQEIQIPDMNMFSMLLAIASLIVTNTIAGDKDM